MALRNHEAVAGPGTCVSCCDLGVHGLQSLKGNRNLDRLLDG